LNVDYLKSTGELASNESLAAQVVALLSHTFPLHVPQSGDHVNGDADGAAGGDHEKNETSQQVNGGVTNNSDTDGGDVWKWKRVTGN